MTEPAFNWDRYITGLNDLIPSIAKVFPWNVKAEELVKQIIPTLGESYTIDGDVAIHHSATIEQGVTRKGAMIIGPRSFIGAHAYLRGGVYLLGDNSIGPGCELKSTVLFPGTNLAHFNFIGDSFVGSDVNFEAGSIVANHHNDRENKTISVLIRNSKIETGVAKFGALIGDNSKIGANAVLSPGTVLERGTIVGRLELVKQC